MKKPQNSKFTEFRYIYEDEIKEPKFQKPLVGNHIMTVFLLKEDIIKYKTIKIFINKNDYILLEIKI